MNKISNITPQPEFNYLGAKLSNKSPNLEVSNQEKNANRFQFNHRHQSKQIEKKKSLSTFKYLIFTTVIIFAFGGLGFGLGLRFGNDIQASSTSVVDN